MNEAIKILDLYCGAGGASKGLKQAFPHAVIIGVDNVLNKRDEYPYSFRWSAIETAEGLYPGLIKYADLIWASPPCQKYTYASKGARNKGKQYPDMMSFTRDLLLKSGKPFIMENVTTAPIRKDLILDGTMFNMKIIRRRAFEIHGFKCEQPPKGKKIGTVKGGQYVTVAGHGGDGKASLKAWQDAMEIHWIKDKKSLANAVPPRYARYIGKQFKKHLIQLTEIASTKEGK